ncbi:unnamed protein product [Effrenium voratum]|nr:unnamed protein product [Effrenium voratum]
MGCGASAASEQPAARQTAAELPYWPLEAPDLSREVPPPQRLAKLLENRSYLEREEHVLNSFVVRCRETDENTDQAHDLLDHLALELASEQRIACAAFARFDKNRNGFLQVAEIEYMLDYLGFPHMPEDVTSFMSTIDREVTDGQISLEEFLQCVGRFGGTCKLFEMRRKQIQARGTDLAEKEEENKDHQRCELLACGLLEDEQASWQPLVSKADLTAAANMEPCQREAIRHVRHLARMNHEQALPLLTERFTHMGYTTSDMWMTLSWIRELAPVIIHVDLKTIAEFLRKDTHYRNQFETASSGGLLDTSVRDKWERSLFGAAYEGAEPFHRPKYGVLNVWNDPQGIYGCEQYGDSYLVLKDLRLRCTLAPQDSGGLPAQRLAVLDYCAHSLMEYTDAELQEMVGLARHGREKIGDSQVVCQAWGKYKEVQIHGEIDLSKHVERLVVPERHSDHAAEYDDLAKAKGWQITWAEEMERELEQKAGGAEMSREDFDNMLEKIADQGEAKEANLEAVPEAAKILDAPDEATQG